MPDPRGVVMFSHFTMMSNVECPSVHNSVIGAESEQTHIVGLIPLPIRVGSANTASYTSGPVIAAESKQTHNVTVFVSAHLVCVQVGIIINGVRHQSLTRSMLPFV